MFCRNCGKEQPEGSRFCPYCGTPNLLAEAEEKAEELIEKASDAVEEGLGEAEEKTDELLTEAAAASDELIKAAEKKEEEIAETYGELSGVAEEKAEELAGLSEKTIESIEEGIEEDEERFAEEAGELTAAAEDKAEELLSEASEAVSEAAAAAHALTDGAEGIAEAHADDIDTHGDDWSLTKEAAEAAEAAGMDPEEAAKVEATASAKAEAEAAAAATAAAAAAAAVKAEKKSNKSAKIWSAVVILALIAAAAGYYFYQNSAPVKLRKLDQKVTQIAAEGNYEEAIQAYTDAIGTGLDDEAIDRSINDLYLEWINSRVLEDPDAAIDLAEDIIEKKPELRDSVLPIVDGIYQTKMDAAVESKNILEATDIYLDASLRFPEVAERLYDSYSAMRDAKAEEIFSGFMTKEFMSLVEGGTLQQIREYMVKHDFSGMMSQLNRYHYGNMIIDAPDGSGKKIGKHTDNGKYVIYVGEYKDGKRSGKGMQVYYAVDAEDKQNKYIIDRYSGSFENDLPNGEFSEREYVYGSSVYEAVMKGRVDMGRYDGRISMDYTEGDRTFTMYGDFNKGSAVSIDKNEDGNDVIMRTEDWSVQLTSRDISVIYGLTPLYTRLI